MSGEMYSYLSYFRQELRRGGDAFPWDTLGVHPPPLNTRLLTDLLNLAWFSIVYTQYEVLPNCRVRIYTGEFSILVSSRKQLLLEWPSPAHSSGFRRCWKHSEECGASIAPVTQSKPLPSYNPPRRGPSPYPPPPYYLLPSPPSSLSSSKTKPLWIEGAFDVASLLRRKSMFTTKFDGLHWWNSTYLGYHEQKCYFVTYFVLFWCVRVA